MRPGQYSLIRCIPDPMRGEHLNVGVILWDDRDVRIHVDGQAAERAVKKSPFLAREAWTFYEPLLHERLLKNGTFDPAMVRHLVDHPPSHTLTLTEPAYVAFEDHADALDRRLEQMIAQMVRTRQYGRRVKAPVEEISERVRPLIKSHRVIEHYRFPRSRTGRTRQADFYINSSANIALDALRLDFQRVGDIQLRTDAEAYKVEDVLANNDVRYVVYCRFKADEQLREINEEMRKTLIDAGADIAVDADEAAQRIRQAARDAVPSGAR